MKKKMGDDAFAGVIVSRLLEKGKRRLQDGVMFGRPQTRRYSRLFDPLIKRFTILAHETVPPLTVMSVIPSRNDNFRSISI